MNQINRFKDLIVYQKAYNLSMDIYEVAKSYPKEEKYALTDQVRRSSRSICANIAESWAKKYYIKAFINKLTDSLGEEYETETRLDYSRDCQNIENSTHEKLMKGYDEVSKMLISMIKNPQKFCK